MKWVMIITWFATGQPPVTTKIEFQSQEKCTKAIGAMHLDYSKKQSKAELMTVCVEI